MNVCTEELAVQIERKIVEVLEKKREDMNVSRAEWGRRAFGAEVSNSQGKIQAIVGKNKSKSPPKRICVGDLVKLCQALELDTTQIISAALLDLGVR